MAKISYNKLGITKDELNKVQTVEYNDQTIEVKQYLPVIEKSELITRVLNNSVDENNGYYNLLKLDMNPDTATIEIESNELVKAKDKEYHKSVDILAKINNNLRIDIEINSERYDSVKFRNTMYLEKITTDTIESGNTNSSMTKYYFYIKLLFL